MAFTDTLCPEHRAWVFGLAGTAVIAAGFAGVALARQTAGAAGLTAAAALCGVAIGLIDATHVPARGQLLAVVFAAVALCAALLVVAQMRLRRWERRVARSVAPLPAEVAAPGPAEAPPGTHGETQGRAAAVERHDASGRTAGRGR